jgi:hypothetical protein
MLINLYKTKTPIAIVSLPLLIAILALTIFMHETPTQIHPFSWESHMANFVNSLPWLNYCLTVLGITITSLQLNNVVNNYGFYTKNSYLPGFLFVLFLMSFNQFYFSLSLIAYALCSFAIGYLFRITRQEDAKSPIFMASLLMGIAIVLTPVLLPIIFVPWITLTMFRSFVWREWLLTLMGYSLPWVYYYAIIFIATGKLSYEKEGLVLVHETVALDWLHLLYYGLIFITILISFFQFLIVMRTQLIRFKKRSRILFHIIWLSIFISLSYWYLYDTINILFILPLSIIVAVQILYSQKLFTANLLIGLWFISAVIYQITEIIAG